LRAVAVKSRLQSQRRRTRTQGCVIRSGHQWKSRRREPGMRCLPRNCS